MVDGERMRRFGGSLGGLYNEIGIGDVEGGLRRWDKYGGFGEEMNREMVGVMGDLNFGGRNNGAQNVLGEKKG
ncbi:UDP-N-acetylglucosamine 2-epimerase, partial [Staphylococcus saprophyticus]|uniref:UDP-N-acetylglucosamine 2-epimerase n=1 Tax=Staphylococcus saprophyticus TaxID=29385 RepID=UPI0011A88742